MEILYLLIPLSLLLVGAIIWIFLWAVRSGQFDDLETPPVRMLFEDAPPPKLTRQTDSTREELDSK